MHFLRPARPRPIGCARSRPQKAATAWSAGFLDLPKFTENNLPRLASSITSGAARKPANARTVQEDYAVRQLSENRARPGIGKVLGRAAAALLLSGRGASYPAPPPQI